MLAAGSIRLVCSDLRYVGKIDVANSHTDSVAKERYALRMLAEWVREALQSANMSGAELARQLTRRLGRSIDRAAVNKMMKTTASERTKPRSISADEMMAISEITGYPPPPEVGEWVQNVPLISWVSAGALSPIDHPVTAADADRMIRVADLPGGDWIALEVVGDSMDRISPPGSIIFVNRRDRRLVPNACYVLMTEDGEATYKRYRPNPDRFEPVSINPSHEAIFPEGQVRVVGRVRRSVLPM